MAFSLSPRFKDDANELGKQLLEFESAVDDPKKNDALRKALIIACRMLSDINLGQLRQRINEILTATNRYNRNWFAEVVGDGEHFVGFLKRVETAMLEGAGLEKRTRDRVINELASLRITAMQRPTDVTAARVISGISELQKEVCLAKEEALQSGQRAANHTRLVKTLCVIAVLVDAVGQAFYPQISPAGLAASIVVGGIKLIPTA